MAIIRVNELPEGSGSLSNDDVFLFMDDPSGSGITKKISLSQIAAVVGGGGNPFDQNLNTTNFPTFSGINLPNSATLSQGTYDNGLGGNSGISLNCVVGYELNWQAGRMKNTYNNGATTYPIYIDSPITYFPTVVSLGSGLSNFATDASAGEIFDFTLTQSLTIDNPINPINGKTIRWRISQDNVGNRSVSFPASGNKFNIPAGASNPLPWSSGVNKTDLLAATYDSDRDKWDIIAFVPGY
jgi:hypothetical protein